MKYLLTWLCTLAISCSAATAAPVAKRKAPTMSQPYTLSIALLPGELHAGGPVTLEIVLTNESTSTARIGQRSLVFDWRYELTWQDGSPVAMTRYGEQGQRSAEGGAPGAVLRTLAPKEQLKAEIPLHRIFDLSTSGSYRLVVARDLPPPDGGAWIAVRSSPLDILLGD
jgi:hypothetical protein